MDTTTARAALWQRVQSLMEAKWGAPNLNRLARSAGVGVATIARMKSAGTSVGLDALEKVSAALDVQAWRLICPQSVLDEKAQEPSPLALDQAAASSQEAERERIRKEEAERLEREQRRAAEDSERAAQIAQQAQAPAEPAAADRVQPTAQAAEPEAPKPAATRPQLPSKASVSNKLELLKAVLAGEVPDDVLTVDLEALAQLCESLGRSVPGVVWSKA